MTDYLFEKKIQNWKWELSLEANTAIAYKAEDQREESSKDSKPRKSLEALSCIFN